MAAQTSDPRSTIERFFRAPFEARTYGNLLFLALAFPLGLAYFIFLAVGLALGLGLTIVWVGLPILALVLLASWGLAALERQMAIHLLGAEVPPMAPAPVLQQQTALQRARAFVSNPVTWKGLGYLAIKFPLGLATFVLMVTALAVSGGLIASPLLYDFGQVQLGVWQVDTLPEALGVSLVGLVCGLVTLNLLNGIAFAWRGLASALLGSRRFTAAPEAVQTVA
jgi:hypothetical protein